MFTINFEMESFCCLLSHPGNTWGQVTNMTEESLKRFWPNFFQKALQINLQGNNTDVMAILKKKKKIQYFQYIVSIINTLLCRILNKRIGFCTFMRFFVLNIKLTSALRFIMPESSWILSKGSEGKGRVLMVLHLSWQQKDLRSSYSPAQVVLRRTSSLDTAGMCRSEN